MPQRGLPLLSVLRAEKAHVAETSSFVASVFCYDQAIKHDIRMWFIVILITL